MESKLKASLKTSTTIRTSTEEIRKKEVPKGAEILSQEVRTETEEIENGWLITKNYDIRYTMGKDKGTEYAYYNKKWYSKEDPLTITVNDQELADAFEE